MRSQKFSTRKLPSRRARLLTNLSYTTTNPAYLCAGFVQIARLILEVSLPCLTANRHMDARGLRVGYFYFDWHLVTPITTSSPGRSRTAKTSLNLFLLIFVSHTSGSRVPLLWYIRSVAKPLCLSTADWLQSSTGLQCRRL